MATVIILTSTLALKGPSSMIIAFKLEEWAILNKANLFRSRLEEQERKSEERSNRANFVLCRDCFWCTSQIRADLNPFARCPVCERSNLESLPISLDESYYFEYSQTRGVNLAFKKDDYSAASRPNQAK